MQTPHRCRRNIRSVLTEGSSAKYYKATMHVRVYAVKAELLSHLTEVAGNRRGDSERRY